MFVRIHEEKRSGQIYVFEVENYWCKLKKGSRQNRKYLGRKDAVTGQLIKKKSYQKTSGCYDFGDSYFLASLSQQMGLFDSLEKSFPEDFKKILSLSFYKILHSQPYYLYSFWKDESFLSEDLTLSAKDISIFLDSIGRNNTAVESFFKYWISHNEPEGVVLFDITSLSSYGKQNEFLEQGYNRDGERLDQINLGVISKKMDRSGHIPMAYKIYPGSINDVVTITNLSKFIDSYNLSAEIFVMDKGFYSEKNLNTMSLQGFNFMLPMSFSTIKSNKIVERVFDNIHSSGSVFAFNNEVYSHVKTEEQVGDYVYDAHVFLDKQLRFSQESVFFKKIIETEEKFEQKSFTKKNEAEDFFEKTCKSRRKFFFLSDKLELTRNAQEIEKEMKCFGFMIILTNKKNLNSKEALTLYRSRDRIEKVFNNLKNDINERRNRVHSLESVKGAMFVNFISLILIAKIDSVMRDKMLYKKLSKVEAYKTLKRLKIYEMASGDLILGEISKTQKTIFSAFQVNPPKNIDRILV